MRKEASADVIFDAHFNGLSLNYLWIYIEGCYGILINFCIYVGMC